MEEHVVEIHTECKNHSFVHLQLNLAKMAPHFGASQTKKKVGEN